MRRPKYSDCIDENDEFDYECYDEAMSNYEDEQRDLEIERMFDKDDQIQMKGHWMKPHRLPTCGRCGNIYSGAYCRTCRPIVCHKG